MRIPEHDHAAVVLKSLAPLSERLCDLTAEDVADGLCSIGLESSFGFRLGSLCRRFWPTVPPTHDQLILCHSTIEQP